MKTIILVLACCFSISAAPTTDIKVDQVGYLANASKIAFVVSTNAANDFIVRRKDGDTVVFRGTLSAAVRDSDSGDQVLIADFTAFKESGTFYLEVSGVGRSWTFAIGKDVYRHAFYLTMRSFYGQRCGTTVDMSPDFSKYKHPPVT